VGRDLFGGTNYNRISWHKLCRPIEKGGFGMIRYKEVVDGIRCRQFGKMFQENYSHPLKNFIVKENKSFASWRCLNETADTVAKVAHTLILGSITKSSRCLSNEEVISDTLLLRQLGEIETIYTVKITQRQGNDLTILVHHWGCNNFREIVMQGRANRGVVSICRST
jgi:hypothetical protein